MKTETKRKICFTIAAMVFLTGVWGALTRKDPVEKNIGAVYVSDGNSEAKLTGHKISVDRNGKKTEYDYPEISSEPEKIHKISVTPESKEKMTISYTKKYYGETVFNIYDDEYNRIIEDQTSLSLPAETDKLYYISVSVVWGTERENVSMIYYFSIQT